MATSARLKTGKEENATKSVTRGGVAARRSSTLPTPPPTSRPKPQVETPGRARSATTTTATATTNVTTALTRGSPWLNENEIPLLKSSRSQSGPTRWRAWRARARRAHHFVTASSAVTTSATHNTRRFSERIRCWPYRCSRGSRAPRRSAGRDQWARSTRRNDRNCRRQYAPAPRRSRRS